MAETHKFGPTSAGDTQPQMRDGPAWPSYRPRSQGDGKTNAKRDGANNDRAN